MKLKHPVLVGGLLVALGTTLGGWLVPVLWGAMVGFVWATEHPGRKAAAAAALGWAALLVLLAIFGFPVGVLASRLGGALGVPAVALVAVTVLFPALLSGCTAVLIAAVRR
jgi:hypothetical protein